MKLRRVVVTGSVLLLTLAVSAMSALTLAAFLQQRLATHLSQATDAVQDVEDLEQALLAHNRESTLFALTRNDAHRAAAANARARVERLLVQTRRDVDDARLEGAVDAAAVSTERYFDEVAHAQTRGLAALESYPAVTRAMDEAYGRSEALMAATLRRSQAEQDVFDRWSRAEAVGGIALAGLIAALATALLVGTRDQVVRPLRWIAEAIHRYGRGERAVRAPETGVSELREISARFNETADALERSREAQLGFLAAVAHDLRNPLSALKSAAGALARDPPRPVVEQVTALVARQVERLERMVGDLLDTTAIEAGRLELRPQRTDLGDLARHAVRLFAAVSTAHAIDLTVSPDEVGVVCDPVRIEQVLNNLLSNAIKYSPPGSRVVVTVISDSDVATIAVTDHGIGIPESEHARVFEPFRRVGATSREVPGLGLGLSVVRRIVEAHHGSIALASAVGEGSTFTVRLPRDTGGSREGEPTARVAPA